MIQSAWEWLKARWRYLRELLGFRSAPFTTGLRLALWAAHCLLQRPATIEFSRWEVRLLLPPRWCGVQKLIYLYREQYEHELEFLHRRLESGQTFVDVGACLGIYSLLAARRVGGTGRVFSFEPSASSFRHLSRNVAMNGAGNIGCLSVALSDREGVAQLYLHRDPGSNSFGADNARSLGFEAVPTTRLDAVLATAGAEPVDALKVDVEGAEELVLRGAARTLESSHPLVILEINPEAAERQGLRPDGALRFLESLGYSFWEAGQGGTLHPFHDTARTGNVVAIHDPNLLAPAC